MKHKYLVIDKCCTDPYYNLALEEYLLPNYREGTLDCSGRMIKRSWSGGIRIRSRRLTNPMSKSMGLRWSDGRLEGVRSITIWGI